MGPEFYFKVDDVDAWYERLRKREVRFSQKPKDMPWGARTAYFKDSDGYLLAIHGPPKMKK